MRLYEKHQEPEGVAVFPMKLFAWFRRQKAKPDPCDRVLRVVFAFAEARKLDEVDQYYVVSIALALLSNDPSEKAMIMLRLVKDQTEFMNEGRPVDLLALQTTAAELVGEYKTLMHTGVPFPEVYRCLIDCAGSLRHGAIFFTLAKGSGR